MVEGGFRHLPLVDASGARAAAAAAATAASGGGGGGGGWLSALGGLIAPLWGAGAGAAEDDEDAALSDAADAAALDGMLPGERANGELRPVAGVLDISHVLTALAFVHEAEQQKREDSAAAAARAAAAGAAGRSGAGGAGKGILSPGAPAAVSGVGKTPRGRGRGDTADDEDDGDGSYCDGDEGVSLSSRRGGGRGAGRDAEEMAAAGAAAAAGGRLPPRVGGVAGAVAAAAARVEAGALRRGSSASLASLAVSAAAGGGAGGFDAASTHSDGASARGRALSVADSFAGTAVTAETAPTHTAVSEEGGAGSGAHGYGYSHGPAESSAATPAPPAAHRLIFDASDPADGRIVALLCSAARAHRRYGDRVKSSSAKIASVAAAETASLLEGGLPAVAAGLAAAAALGIAAVGIAAAAAGVAAVDAVCARCKGTLGPASVAGASRPHLSSSRFLAQQLFEPASCLRAARLLAVTSPVFDNTACSPCCVGVSAVYVALGRSVDLTVTSSFTLSPSPAELAPVSRREFNVFASAHRGPLAPSDAPQALRVLAVCTAALELQQLLLACSIRMNEQDTGAWLRQRRQRRHARGGRWRS
jgi:hypothetical protein